MQPANVLATIQGYVQDAIQYGKVIYLPDEGLDCWDSQLMEAISAEATLNGWNIDFVIIPIGGVVSVDDAVFVTMHGNNTSNVDKPYSIVYFSGYNSDTMLQIRSQFNLPSYVRRMAIAVDGNLNRAFFYGYFA